MANQNELRQRITNQIVEALESGNLPPWRRPWSSDKNAGSPANVVSKKRYSGLNPLLLELAAQRHGFASKWWATFRQWEQLGGRVMRRPENVPSGQWGTQVIFYSPITKRQIDANGEETEDRFFVLKSYTVFNVDQVEGLDHLRVSEEPATEQEVTERYEQAEVAVSATGADIRYGGDKAFFCPTGDYIQMPHRHQFSLPEYYETLCHELVHWTEPSHRLNWDRAGEGYAQGELIAEIGGCFLATELGLPTGDNLQNHASYLKSWLNSMKGDPRFIFKAATQASKAVDYLLSFSRQCEPEAVQEPAIVV